MPIYPGRRPGTWRVTIYTQKKQHEWTIEGKKAEAEAFEARKRVELEAGARIDIRTAPTLRDFCFDVYRPHAEQHLKSSTWTKVRVYQIGTLVEELGELKLTELSLDAIERYKRKPRLVGTGSKARPPKPSTINNELRVLKTILRYAKDLGYAVLEPKWKKIPVRGSARVHVWTPTQVTKLFEAANKKAPELVPLLSFLINTGCRKGEAIAAEWSWIDREAGMIRIPSNDVWTAKNGMPREIPISRSLGVVLDGCKKDDRYVFVTQRSKSEDKPNRYQAFPKDRFNECRTLAGLSGGPHTLRHSFASMFLQARPDMFLLAQILGHSHGRVTELYSHLLPDHLARARDAVDFSPPVQPEEGRNSGSHSG